MSDSFPVATTALTSQQVHDGLPFPLVFECRSPSVSLADTISWLAKHARKLGEQASIHGAVLFRGFTFFNQLIAASRGWKDTRNDPSKSISFGDGTPLDASAALLAAELAEEITFDLAWQRGDVALVDNYVTMHGRRTFSGTRKVLASLIAA